MISIVVLTLITSALSLALSLLLVVRTSRAIDAIEDLENLIQQKHLDVEQSREFVQNDLNNRLEQLQRSKFGYVGRNFRKGNATNEEK